jgi:5-methylcytosine-specific restriction endonuclease McrBC GTP-binding regulatory subunit McrB
MKTITITISQNNQELERINGSQIDICINLIQWLANKLPENIFERLLFNRTKNLAKPIKIVKSIRGIPPEETARQNNGNSKSLALWRLNNKPLIETKDNRIYLVRVSNNWSNGNLLGGIKAFAEENHYKISINAEKEDTDSLKDGTAFSEQTLYPSKNVILYGPPGTGKTFTTVSLSTELIHQDTPSSWADLLDIVSDQDEEERDKSRSRFKGELGKRIHFITFHQSYSYEDFIGGLRPVSTDDSNHTRSGLGFKWQPGIFTLACAAAWQIANNPNPSHDGPPDVEMFLDYCSKDRPPQSTRLKPFVPVVLVIDEINRANMSRVFGELITLLEDDKRLDGKEELLVDLPNHPLKKKFGVPANLFIIGTMNTADKSLALLDLALRRRFEFLRLDPDPQLIPNGAIRIFLETLNKAIAAERRSFDYGIGHAYFPLIEMPDEELNPRFSEILQRRIVPLLQEYFHGDDEKVVSILETAGIELKPNLKLGGKRLIPPGFTAAFRSQTPISNTENPR